MVDANVRIINDLKVFLERVICDAEDSQYKKHKFIQQTNGLFYFAQYQKFNP